MESGPILRVFDAIPHLGSSEVFAQELHGTSAELVRAQPGYLGHIAAHPIDDRHRTHRFLTLWQDLDAVRQFAGDDGTRQYFQMATAAFSRHGP